MAERLLTLEPRATISVFDTNAANLAEIANRDPAIQSVENITNLADCTALFICTPVGTVPDYVIELARIVGDDAIILDTGSSKRSIVQAVSAALPTFDRFVPGHPIGGSHLSGPGAADTQTLKGKAFVLTPYEQTASAAVSAAIDLLTRAGFRTLTTTVEEHDRILSLSSHLPHLIAFSMVNQFGDRLLEPGMGDLIANSFRSMTVFAAGNPVMWRDIFSANDEAILASLEGFRRQLDLFEQAIRNKDKTATAALIEQSHRLRKELD